MKRTKQLGAVALAVILLACGPPPAAAFSTWGVNRPDGRTPNCPLDQGQVELLQQQFPSTRTDCGSGGPLICTQCMCLLARSTTTTLIKKCGVVWGYWPDLASAYGAVTREEQALVAGTIFEGCQLRSHRRTFGIYYAIVPGGNLMTYTDVMTAFTSCDPSFVAVNDDVCNRKALMSGPSGPSGQAPNAAMHTGGTCGGWMALGLAWACVLLSAAGVWTW
ncbi:hypothetical protein FOA52_001550 [Chlamydomonas sp. UWO 241]|nr:hypothetical protein FOA52_001550 [Chlamydomonas sp. UWO 241]